MRELSLRQWHHGYLGTILAAVGWKGHWTWLIVVGAIILADDLIQHTVQWITQTEWHSPLRRLYNWVYIRVGFVRKVNEWLDSLFH